MRELCPVEKNQLIPVSTQRLPWRSKKIRSADLPGKFHSVATSFHRLPSSRTSPILVAEQIIPFRAHASFRIPPLGTTSRVEWLVACPFLVMSSGLPFKMSGALPHEGCNRIGLFRNLVVCFVLASR
jgi:hypothetical protein